LPAHSLSIRVILSFLAQEFILLLQTLLPLPLPPPLPLPLLPYFVIFIVRASTPNGILLFTLLCYFVATLVTALVATLVDVVIDSDVAILPPQLRSHERSRLLFYF